MNLKIDLHGKIILLGNLYPRLHSLYLPDSSPRILSPAVAEEGDKIFYVLGAQYPLIPKNFHHLTIPRLANRAVVHPDGPKEYSFRGEALSRYVPDLPTSSNIENMTKILDINFNSLHWGLMKETYRRILKTAPKRRHLCKTELCYGPRARNRNEPIQLGKSTRTIYQVISQ